MTKHKLWFTSDTHFGHENILTFKDDDHNYTRPFKTIEEHDEYIIEKWNSVVGKDDYVYHLGDVAFRPDVFKNIMPKLNGSKRLIIGNHDEIKKYDMVNYFKKINLWRVFREYDLMCTHIPLHRDSMKTGFNVHGHIHHNISSDLRHINVCVEHHDYTPVSLDWLLVEIERRKKIMRVTEAEVMQHACSSPDTKKIIGEIMLHNPQTEGEDDTHYHRLIMMKVMIASFGKCNPQAVQNILEEISWGDLNAHA